MAGNENSGRKRKPTQLKLVEGQHYRLNERKNEPVAMGELSDAPAHFSDQQRAIWAYAIQHAPRGLLKASDGPVLETWCIALCLHRKATEMVNSTPVIIKTANGTPIQSPWLAVLNKQAIVMRSLVSELGFSPAARARISLADEEEADPLAHYFGE